MMGFLKQIRVEWLVTAFCAWHAAGILNDAGLLHAWRRSPYDRLGWLALVLWAVPAVRAIGRGGNAEGGFRVAIISLAIALIGVLGDLNFLVYWGLAGSIGSLARVSCQGWLWLVLAICWMPAFGWIGSQLHMLALPVNILRLLAAFAAAGAGWCGLTPAPPKTSA